VDESNKSVDVPQASDTEIAFWRSISNNNDPNELELYLQQFPDGAYAKLAKIKLAKSRDSKSSNNNEIGGGQQARQAKEERAGLEADRNAAQKEREAETRALAELEQQKAKVEAELAEREADYHRRVAEIDALRKEEAKSVAEVRAREKTEFEARLAKQEADLQAQLERQKEALTKNEEELKKKEAAATYLAEEIRKKRGSLFVPVAIVLIVVIFGMGGFYFFRPSPAPDQDELIKMLGEATKANQDLMQAREKEQVLERRVVAARAAEAEAKALGDVVRQKQLAEESRKQEAELAKQVEEVKKREAEEKKLAEAQAKKKAELQNLVKQSDADKKAEAEKTTAERVVAEKAAKDRATADRALAERAEADKAALEKGLAEKEDRRKADEQAKRAEEEAKTRRSEQENATRIADQRALEFKKAESRRKEELDSKNEAESKERAAASAKRSGRQSWEYRYLVTNVNRIGLEIFGTINTAYLLVEYGSGRPSVRLELLHPLYCYRGELNASIVETNVSTVITVPSQARDCEESRFVLKKDGSGGQREIRQGSSWIWDGEDHGLATKK
jgi:hypothetical protein